MPLSTEESIATDGLLIEREAAYANVAEIETSINLLFGGDYPFPAPESIPPSCTKRKAPKATKASPKSSKRNTIRLRRLKDNECAYRYRWVEKEEEHEAHSIEARLIETFLKDPPDGVRVVSVQTVDLEGNPREDLFKRDDQ